MKMTLITTFDELIQKFPLIKVIPQVKDLLDTSKNSEFWIYVKAGKIYLSKKTDESEAKK